MANKIGAVVIKFYQQVRMKKEKKVKRIFTLVLILLLVCSSCAGTNLAPAPESDSSQRFIPVENVGIPVDDNVYTIVGEIVVDVNSLVRQTEAARGSYSGYGSGYASGTYYGPEYGGKGFVRVLVLTSDSKLAPVGNIVILKSTDTKGTALLPGDVVTFKCRAQYEALAAVRDNEIFGESAVERLATWELDYCRLATPVIDTTSVISSTDR